VVGSPFVQEEKYQEKPVKREVIAVIIIIIIITITNSYGLDLVACSNSELFLKL
jgi:hypothetical protein